MLTVHHLENSRSQRVLWLLEELGVEYEIKRYGRDKQTSLAPPELKEIHPLGKAPVIVDNDVTMAESGAIIEYLVHTYDDGKLHPVAGTPEWRSYTYWMHYAEGTFMPLMIISLILGRIETSPMPFFVKTDCKRHRRQGACKLSRRQRERQPRFHGRNAERVEMVLWRPVHGRRRADEFCARGGRSKDGSYGRVSASRGIPQDPSLAASLQGSVGSRRALRIDGYREEILAARPHRPVWAFYV